MGRLPVWLALAAVVALGAPLAAQTIALDTAWSDSAGITRSMRSLAASLPTRDLTPWDRFRVQLTAGLALQPATPPGALDAVYAVFARAERLSAGGGRAFEAVLPQAFRDVFIRLDDRTAALAIRTLLVPPAVAQAKWHSVLDAVRGRTAITRGDANQLVRAYLRARVYGAIAPLAAPLIGDDDRRRYTIERDLAVRTGDAATVCATVVRPRRAGRLPALLEFTIYADTATNFREARRSASNGYAGVTGLSRGKGCSPDAPVPYEHDLADAAALIDWISRQPWSDGRVGMFSGSYVGFTQWAAAKHMPRALKAIMPAVPVAPGLDVPMEGSVVWNFVYPWTFYTLDNRGLDTATYNDFARWRRLNRTWYTSGAAYRKMDSIDGTPNPGFARWLAHPSYDAYWQSMIPYGDEFAHIKIPVLMTAGYFFGGPGAAVYYFSQHQAHDPAADDYLVIGPYDHPGGQRGVVDAFGDTTAVFAGYELDPVARIDLTTLRYQWFDYVFKHGPKPVLLQDRVNYQVMGANEWKHAPTIAAMSNRTLRFYLSGNRLASDAPALDGFVTHTVDLADRRDIDSVIAGGGILDSAIDRTNAVWFESAPLPQAAEVSGLFSGHLDLITNKRDFDFNVQLYEHTPDGRYFMLPPYWARASFVGDLEHRRLLTPGVRTALDFRSVRLVSRRVAAGSRIVLVLSVLRNPGQQINYGTGLNVSDETIADAGAPLVIQWYSGSHIDLPISR